MKSVRILALMLFGSLASVAWGQGQACDVSANWAQFHRTNMRRWNRYENVLNVGNVGSLGLKWSYNVSGSVYSSPALANGVVYVTGDYYLYALNACTGALLWSYDTAWNGSSQRYPSPAVANGVVYIGSGVSVYALKASTGEKLWAYDTGYVVASSPVVADGVPISGRMITTCTR